LEPKLFLTLSALKRLKESRCTTEFIMPLPIQATGIELVQITDQQNMITEKVWVP
jgi:hypothetical protein